MKAKIKPKNKKYTKNKKLKLYGFNNLTKTLSFNIYDISYGTNKKLGCNSQSADDPSVWFNLDYSGHSCERGGYKWRVGQGDANVETDYNPGGNGNDSSYCRYNLLNPIGSGTPSSECCCGDDTPSRIFPIPPECAVFSWVKVLLALITSHMIVTSRL